MTKKLYFRGGVWPALVFLLLSHLGYLPGSGAILLALAYGAVYLVVAGRAGEIGPTDYGLVVFLAAVGSGLTLAPETGRRLVASYFFFGLYSAIFLSLTVPLWLGLETLSGEDDYELGLAAGRAERQQRALWAGIFLASALLSLKSGMVFKVLIPLALFAFVGLPLSHYFRPRPNRRVARPAAVVEPPRSDAALSPRSEAEETAALELGPVAQALVVQGSPRGEGGVTELVSIPFVAGLKAEGVEVEVVHLKDKDIKPCDGDFTCWVQTPGRCHHDDDMADLQKKLVETDLVVLAAPLQFGSVPGLMKDFLDRCLPMWEPWAVAHPGGGTYRPPRAGALFGRRLLLLAVGSMPSEREFAPLIALAEELARLGDTPLVGRLIRPSADLLLLGQWLGRTSEQVQRALFAAGREVARRGAVSAETEALVRGPLFRDEAAFRLAANIFWETWQDYCAARRAGVELPDLAAFLAHDVRLGLASMVLTFDPAQLAGQELTFQFNLSGRQPGQWYLKMKNGRCTLHEGWAVVSDIVIHSPSEVWVALARGEIKASQAIADGHIRLEGQTELLDDMPRLFGWIEKR